VGSCLLGLIRVGVLSLDCDLVGLLVGCPGGGVGLLLLLRCLGFLDRDLFRVGSCLLDCDRLLRLCLLDGLRFDLCLSPLRLVS
jgi:hypothetical protein